MELCRIVSMFLIVMSHVVTIPYNNQIPTGTINSVILEILSSGGGIGVSIFILISGYFGIKFSLKKIFKLWSLTFFYSILFLLLYLICENYVEIKPLSIKLCVHYLLPVSTSLYWFISAYFMLFLLSPFINKLIENINTKYLISLTVLLVIFTYFNIPRVFYSFSLTYFISLYLIGYILKRFDIPNKVSNKFITFVLISCFLFYLSFFLIENFTDIGRTLLKANMIIYHNSIITLIIALCIIILFARMKSFYSPLINKISLSVLSVYLIHGNPFILNLFIRNFNLDINSPIILFGYILIATITIFSISVFIDKCRVVLLIPFSTNIEKINTTFINYAEKIFNKITNFVLLKLK